MNEYCPRMAYPEISQSRRPREEKQLIVKRDQIKLREPLHLKEEQFQKIRTFNDSDFCRSHIDVYPPTYIVHSKTSEQKFGLKKCIIVTTSSTAANIRVFDAPKFCCNKPAAPEGRFRDCDSGGAYKSVEKSDICFIMVVAQDSRVAQNRKKAQILSDVMLIRTKTLAPNKLHLPKNDPLLLGRTFCGKNAWASPILE
ncbi:hypothetical protein PFISCL1PPCAC_11612, partial [Pristionchus fissidentatus]